MRYLFMLFASLVCLSSATAGSPKIPKEVAAQWALFQDALKKDDLPALTAMAKFPLACNEFKGDIRTPKDFARQYKTLFPKETKRAFLSAQLHPQVFKGETTYEVWAEVSHLPISFIFKPIKGKLYLVEIDNVNE